MLSPSRLSLKIAGLGWALIGVWVGAASAPAARNATALLSFFWLVVGLVYLLTGFVAYLQASWWRGALLLASVSALVMLGWLLSSPTLAAQARFTGVFTGAAVFALWSIVLALGTLPRKGPTSLRA